MHFTLSYIRKGMVPIGKYKLQVNDKVIENDIDSLMDIDDDIDSIFNILRKHHNIIIDDKFAQISDYKVHFPNSMNIDVVRLTGDGFIILTEQLDNTNVYHLKHINTGSNNPSINTIEYIYTNFNTKEMLLRLHIIDMISEITVHISGKT